MKLFFLGGTSYLGREIIKRLQTKNVEISVYVRSPESANKLEGLKVNKVFDVSGLSKQDVVFNLVVDYGKDKELSEVMAANVEFHFLF